VGNSPAPVSAARSRLYRFDPNQADRGHCSPMTTLNPTKTTLERSGEDVKLHSKRVEKIQKYTQNDGGHFCERHHVFISTSNFHYTTFTKLHSKRVEKMENYTQNEWRRWCWPAASIFPLLHHVLINARGQLEAWKLHSFWVEM
jgi:hypothetical protein